MGSTPPPRRRRLFLHHHHHHHHHHLHFLLLLLLSLLIPQTAAGKVAFPGETGTPGGVPASLDGVGESSGEASETPGDAATLGEKGKTSAIGQEGRVSDPAAARGLWESDAFFLQKLSNFFSGSNNESKRPPPPPKRKVSSSDGLLPPPSAPSLNTRRKGVDRPGQVNVVRVPAGAPPPMGATPLGSRPPLDPKKIPVLIPNRPGGPPAPSNAAKPVSFMTRPGFSPQHLQHYAPDDSGPANQVQRVSVGHRPTHLVRQQQQKRPHVQTQRIQQTSQADRVQQLPQPQVIQQIPQLLKIPQVTRSQNVQHISQPQIVQKIPHALKVPQPESVKHITEPQNTGPTASRPHSIQYTPAPHRIEHRPEPERVQQKPQPQIQIPHQPLHHRPASGLVKLKPLFHMVQAPPKRVVQRPPQDQQHSQVKFPKLEAQESDLTFSQTKNPAQLTINLSPGLPVIPQVTVDPVVPTHDFPYPFVQPNLSGPTKEPSASFFQQPQPPSPPQPQPSLQLRPSKPVKPHSQPIKKPTSTFADTGIVPSPGASTSGVLLRQPSTLHPRPAPQPTLVFHSLKEKKSSNLIKTSLHHEETSKNNFSPSPQEGSYAADAFQPIFVASKSLDNGFGKDDMIPISVPNSARATKKAKAKAGPIKPEMLDFF